MKTEHRPTYLIDPKNKGFVVDYLESLKMDYTITSSFSPEKLTLKWRQK